MVKMQHLILGALMVVIALLSVITTVIVTGADPYANLEHVAAQAGSSASGELIAVPIATSGSGDFLAVISKLSGAPSVTGERGASSGVGLAIYRITNQGEIKLESVRRINYDLQLATLELGDNQDRSNNDLHPGRVASEIERALNGDPEEDD